MRVLSLAFLISTIGAIICRGQSEPPINNDVTLKVSIVGFDTLVSGDNQVGPDTTLTSWDLK